MSSSNVRPAGDAIGPPALSGKSLKGQGGKEQIDDGELESAATSEARKDTYKWVIVFAMVLQSMALWGMNTTFGVFLSFYTSSDYFGGDVSDYLFALVGGLALACAFILAPFSNWLTSKFGFKPQMWFGCLLIVTGQLTAGLGHSIGALIVTQGVLFGAGMSFLYVPALPLVSQWHDRTRALANGIVSAGSGIGALAWSLETRAAIQNVGLRDAFFINGCICAALLVPSTLLLKSRSREIKAKFQPLRLSLFRNMGFVCIAVYAFFAVLSYVIGIYSLATFATAGLGMSQSNAATLQALLAVGQIVGRPIAGLYLDRVGAINGTILVSCFTSAIILFLWMLSRSFAPLAVFAVLNGATGGIVFTALSPMITRVLSLQQLGSALSLIWVVLVAPALVAQIIAFGLLNYSRDVLGRDGASAFLIPIGAAGTGYAFGAIALVGAKYSVTRGAKGRFWTTKC